VPSGRPASTHTVHLETAINVTPEPKQRTVQ
jgi:hypothetical protein